MSAYWSRTSWASVSERRADSSRPAKPAPRITTCFFTGAEDTNVGGKPPPFVRAAPCRAGEGRGEASPNQSETGAVMTLNLQTLETSFDVVAPRGDELMDVFYARLFAAAPAVKPLFAGTDLKKQKTMLLGTLVLLRKSLRDLDAVVPKLRELGARHLAYGAAPEQYP